MRQWIRSRRDTQTCGACGTLIPRGTAMLELTIVQCRTLIRCASCAGEPAPAFVAPLPEQLDARAHLGDGDAAQREAAGASEWMPFRDGDEHT